MADEMKTYRVAVERSGSWWAAHVPVVQGVHTQARRLGNVETAPREAIALMLDVEPDNIAVQLDTRVNGVRC